jgi:hypothetical protein
MMFEPVSDAATRMAVVGHAPRRVAPHQLRHAAGGRLDNRP